MQIVKRNGKLDNWDASHIRNAFYKACYAVYGKKSDEIIPERQVTIESLADIIVERVEIQCKGLDRVPSVSDVQHFVINEIVEQRLADVVVAYATYKKDRERYRANSDTLIDVKDLIDGYRNGDEWRANENANIAKSYQGLILHISGTAQAKYTLSNLPSYISDAHTNNLMHIHDLGNSLVGYCAGWSLRDLLLDGFGEKNECTSTPANGLSGICGQIFNFLGTLQNEWAGAQAFNNVDTYLAPFIRKDNLSYKEVKQCIQSLIFSLNTTSRWGGQCVPTTYEAYTPNGWLQRDELKEGDLIYVMLPDGTVGTRAIEKFKDDTTENCKMYKLITDHNEYECTDYHRCIMSATGDIDDAEMITAEELYDLVNKDNDQIYYIPEYDALTKSVAMHPVDMQVSHYSGDVWCPSTPAGTWITSPTTSTSDWSWCTGNCPFTNFTFDLKCPKHMEHEAVIIKGAPYKDWEYGDFQKEMDMINKAFVDIFIHGDGDGKCFSFPIPTYNVTEDFDWSTEVGDGILEMTRKYGSPYFQNFINSDLNPEDVRSMCPMHKDTRLNVKFDEHDKVSRLVTLGDLYAWHGEKEAKGEDSSFYVPFNKKWYKASITAFRESPIHFDDEFDVDASAENIYNRDAFRRTVYEKTGVDLPNYHPIDYSKIEKGDIEARNKAREYELTHRFPEYIKLLNVITESSFERMSMTHEQPIRRNGKDIVVEAHQIKKGDEILFHKTDHIAHTTEKVYEKVLSIKDEFSSFPFTYCIAMESNETNHQFELASGMVTHNCRLQMDLRQLKRLGGIFGSGDLTGSIGVCTLNLPRFAYLSHGNKETFMSMVKHYARVGRDYLELKRKDISHSLEVGRMKWTAKYLKRGFKGHFSTLGIVGGNEACLNLIGKDITDPESIKLMQDVIALLKAEAEKFYDETGHLFNVEAVPAESTAYKFAMHDKEEFSDIITQGTDDNPYYTNSTLLPVDATTDPVTALMHQDKLQPLYNGGTVFHTFVGEAMPNKGSVKVFLENAMRSTKIPYISLTPTYSVCPEHGYVYGENWECPSCGKPCEVFTRIVGYYRPVSRWNKGKKAEYKDRTVYEMDNFITEGNGE